MRRTYTLNCDDIEGFGGEIVLERWGLDRGLTETRLLLIERNAWHNDHRANLCMSRDEARRLARQLLAMAERA